VAKHILVVDDEPAIRRVLAASLRRAGYEVTEAGDGAEAARVMEVERFDLVVTDIVMPEREGLETIQLIRRDHPGTQIIAISAPSNDDYLRAARSFGAARTFRKPFSLSDVTDAVAELLAS
jgi:CheY-like chemotaxis protein